MNAPYVRGGDIDRARENVREVHYKNIHEEGAVTAVPRETFVSARPVQKYAVPVDRHEVERQEVVGHGPPVAPEEISRRPSVREVHAPVARSAPNTPPPMTQRPQPSPRPQPSWNVKSTAVEPVHEQRKVEERQLEEDAKMQQRHQQERAAPAAAAQGNQQELREKQGQEQRAQEQRHEQERAAAKTAAPVPAAAPKPAPKPVTKEKEKEKGKPPVRWR